MRNALVVMVGLFCTACNGAPSPSARPSPSVVARIGTVSVTAQMFELRLRSALTALSQAGGPAGNTAMTSRVRASVLRSLLIDGVIAEEAAAANVAASDGQVQSQLNADAQAAGGLPQLQAQLAPLGGSLDQLRDEIRSSLNEQRLEDVFARQRAAEIEQRLASGGQLPVLAGQYSDDSKTAATGGDLGAVPRSQIQGDDPAYASAVLALKPGQHTDPPIHDAQGYDIVFLTAETPTMLTLAHIIVDAPQPYTVKERPRWFSQAIFEALAQACSAGGIHVYIHDVGDDPCAAAISVPSPAVPAPGTPAP